METCSVPGKAADNTKQFCLAKRAKLVLPESLVGKTRQNPKWQNWAKLGKTQNSKTWQNWVKPKIVKLSKIKKSDKLLLLLKYYL